MSQKTEVKSTWALDSIALDDAYTDFILSRQAIRASQSTLDFYKFTAGVFVTWLKSNNVNNPPEVTARHVRAYLAELTARKVADKTAHAHARAIKTLLRFWHAEKYMPEATKFDMPKMDKKRLPVLDANEVGAVLAACHNSRDKALLLFAVDTGLRLAELASLYWGDMDMANGVVHLPRGKAGKARTVIAGAAVRRALLAYRRTLKEAGDGAPIFQTDDGLRLSPRGLQQVFKRLSRRAGVKFSAHALRRTFCILSLRAGMDVLHLQALMGHASLAMTQHYAQLLDEDILNEHKAHSPIDNLARLKKR